MQDNATLGQKVRVRSVGRGFNDMLTASLNMTWSLGVHSVPSL